MENDTATSQEEQEKKDNDAPVNVDNGEDTPPVDNSADDSTDDGSDGFDPKAFSVDNNPSSNGDEGSDDGKQDDQPKGEDDDLEFDWASYDEPDNDSAGTNDDSTDDGSPTDTPSDVNKDQDGDDSNEGSEPEGNRSTSDAFKQVASELGLEVESLDELKETLAKIESENEELRNNANSGNTNEKVKKLQEFADKSDEDLVKLELKKQGFTDEEIQTAVDGYTDNGNLWIEAKKIRNTIKQAISNEQQAIAKANKEAQAMQEKTRQEAVKNLTNFINEQDTMFGFKMAKDEATLQKVREGHQKYITSGDFLADVTKDEKNLTEAAWLWKNKDVIMKAVGNREFNKGKQNILDDISNPDIPDKSRFRDPDGSDEFDPTKFTS